MDVDQNRSFKGDRALGVGEEDRLGFREVAKRLAVSLVDRASEDGFVVGIEGAWGSGKSSLVFLVQDELGKLPEKPHPTVINFRPWLIGNRDALITSLFAELSNQLDRVALDAGDATPATTAKAIKAAEALRSFIGGLTKAGGMVEVAGDALGSIPINLAGKGIKAAGELIEGKRSPPQLSDLKDKLSKTLRELGQRIIVVVDDVDRLEPTEVIEILRLVRSVIDLPNVIYLLCYDSEIIARSIEMAVGVNSGRAYLEKIVQLTVMVPKPESLQLRQWFTDELGVIASVKDEDERLRLNSVIAYEGGRQLQTPRSVIRALDAVRFFWPPLREAKADLADFVWLQLIRDANPTLYRWIEDYCSRASAISLGMAAVEKVESEQLLATLHQIVPAGYFDDLKYRHNFAEILPGLEADYSDETKSFVIFVEVNNQDRADSIQNRRLASPDHYKFYFALVGPSHALTQEDFESVWSAAESGEERVGAALLHLHGQQAAGSLTKADLLLERIGGGAYKVIPPGQCENILLAMAQIMDRVCSSFDPSWVNSIWDRGQYLVPLLILRVEPPNRDAVIAQMFKYGAAISWLTSLFRYEMFAHGREGKRRRPEREWLFSDQDLDLITEIMLDRYRRMSMDDIFSSPNPISLLFAWYQGGDRAGPRRLIEGNIVSDEGFIATLEHLITTIVSSNRGKIQVIKKENIDPFMDFDEVEPRLRELEEHNDLAERAKRLMIALENSRDW